MINFVNISTKNDLVFKWYAVLIIHKFRDCLLAFNPLQPGVAFLYSLKTSENR